MIMFYRDIDYIHEGINTHKLGSYKLLLYSTFIYIYVYVFVLM
jgi:hypothetical protein